MRRYEFYIFIALLTFVIGSFIALKIYRDSPVNSYKTPKSVFSENFSKQSDIKSRLENPPVSFQTQEIQEESSKPFCRDKRILRIWKYLIKDRDFQTWEPGSRESLDCGEMFEIKEIDLNLDGKSEILLRGKNFNFCSAVGNCAFWIYQKKGKTYRKLLYSTDYIDVSELGEQVKKSRTKGYFNILLKGHWNVSDTFHITYKFDGRKYAESQCLVDYYVRATQPNPKWKFITCREHARLEDY